ncbi:hypothetical protein [Nocardioides hwasunensis]|uniref:WXG100 family type VII secretion target n=1 Tax=Nocardioides hwasunensis TaxID=397258 RepID=A0ABR8MHS7_9ACTN|nr:hypothetical protein [Nocardioides hwasunensis]MBD3915533.1 hypothetical protein [Nocardioides hwasunensis]
MSGDYSYDDEGVTLSNSDSGANTATSLDGYDGEINPNQNWPGTVVNKKELVAKPDDMRTVAKELKDLADRIRESSSVREVERASNDVQMGPSDWQATNYLKQAGVQTAGLVAGGAKQIAANLDQAAAAIEAAADGYDNAEQSNQSGFNR